MSTTNYQHLTNQLTHALRTGVTVYNFAESTEDKAKAMSNLSNLIDRFGIYLSTIEGCKSKRVENMGELVGSVVNELQSERVHAIITDVSVKGSAELLKIVVDELVSNALQFSTGEVYVSLHKTDRHAVLRVEDFGCGLSDYNLSCIAEPFSASDNQRSGQGLGLALTWAIVQEHNGAMTIDNSQKDSGTTVLIMLDLVQDFDFGAKSI